MGYFDRYRIIRLSEDLQKEFCHPKYICVDPLGMPFIIGDEFYDWLVKVNCCQEITAKNYLSLIFHFFTFLWKGDPHIQYTAPSEIIRNRMREYLIDKLNCRVRPHRSGNYEVRLSANSPQSARLFITALRSFYKFAILHNKYKYVNPMDRNNIQAKGFLPRMPPASGMTSSDEGKGRVPDTYFCFVGEDWKPNIIDDPDIPKRLLPKITNKRDFIIATILFQSGARISEILGLTIGDWKKCNQGNRAKTINKGSNGMRVKEIWWDSETTVLLRRYINNYRRDLQLRKLDELNDSDNIFVTDDGRPLSYFAFYANWKRACIRAGVKFSPHQVRHWFVTRALKFFSGHPEEQREEERQAFFDYMGWQNRNSIHAYDHHIRATDFTSAHAALSQLSKLGLKKKDNGIVPLVVSSTPGNLTQADYEFFFRLPRS